MARLYVNAGPGEFQAALNADIYVDKTLIVSHLNRLINTSNRFVCMVRPRRFGKSYVGDLMCAYYSRGYDTEALFQGLNIAQDPSFKKNLNGFDIISLDIGGLYSAYPEHHHRFVTFLAELVRGELRQDYPDVVFPELPNIAADICAVNAATDRKFIIFFDEYDALVRTGVPSQTFNDYLAFLNGLFKDKSCQRAIALAYITGILPVVRDRFQSKLNNFEEYSFLMPENFAPFMGFTEDEAQALCKRYNMSFEECKLWYDGYQLPGGISIFAPYSVCRAMKAGMYDDYWSRTSTFNAVLDVIKYSQFDLKEVILALVRGERVRVDTTSYMNTMTDFHCIDDVLTFSIQLGYLAYDVRARRCYIPNAEVRKQWEHIAAGLEGTKVVAALLKDSDELLEATIGRDAAAVARGLQKAHDVVCSNIGYSNEAAFQAAISYAYYYAQNAYTILKELPTGQGFADVVFLPKYPSLAYPAIVLELKVDTAADTAMDQIIARKYGADLLHYRGSMMLVGVSYNTKTKAHSCEIRDFVVG